MEGYATSLTAMAPVSCKWYTKRRALDPAGMMHMYGWLTMHVMKPLSVFTVLPYLPQHNPDPKRDVGEQGHIVHPRAPACVEQGEADGTDRQQPP